MEIITISVILHEFLHNSRSVWHSVRHSDGITEDMIRLAVTSGRAFIAVQKKQVDDVIESSQSCDDADPIPSDSFHDLICLLSQEGEWNDYAFRELMRDLCSYSLVQHPLPGVYSIHPLVHKWEASIRKKILEIGPRL